MTKWKRRNFGVLFHTQKKIFLNQDRYSDIYNQDCNFLREILFSICKSNTRINTNSIKLRLKSKKNYNIPAYIWEYLSLRLTSFLCNKLVLLISRNIRYHFMMLGHIFYDHWTRSLIFETIESSSIFQDIHVSLDRYYGLIFRRK